MVVFRRTDHEKHPGAIEIRAAEFPERAAYRVDHSGRHVDGAKTAVRGLVRCAELAREQARQCLHLIAPGKERKLLRIGRPNARKALLEH